MSAGGNGSAADGLPWFRLPGQFASDMGWSADVTVGLDSQVIVRASDQFASQRSIRITSQRSIRSR